MWQRSLAHTISLQPEHISAYNLTYEEDTDFFRRFVSGELTQDHAADADLFEHTADTLAAAGYDPYEISNFARTGRECAHNLAYWQGGDYLGLGPSAFSTVGERRWANVRDNRRLQRAHPPRAVRRRFPRGRAPGDAARGEHRVRPADQPGGRGGRVG